MTWGEAGVPTLLACCDEVGRLLEARGSTRRPYRHAGPANRHLVLSRETENQLMERVKARVMELVNKAEKAADRGDLYAVAQRLRDMEMTVAEAQRRLDKPRSGGA